MDTVNHLHGAKDFSFLFTGLLIFLVILYYLASLISNRRYRKWPAYRGLFWIAGALCVGIAIAISQADHAHTDFRMHMMGHLLLGMLAPILITYAAPVTLLLRTLPQSHARKLTYVLKSRPIRFLSHPTTAALLNVGGLWILYTTDLFAAMQHSTVLHVAIHIHVFISGYLFTVAMIYMDLTPHRMSYIYRAIILIAALAGHDLLAKFIYISPPAGVPHTQAQAAAKLMYYGGDFIELILIIIFCYQWYQSKSPKRQSIPLNLDPSKV